MSAPAEEKETGRIEAFSDGVFAIAITLLVLELKVPHLEDGGAGGSLTAALLRQWPSYVALVTSFFTILVMWANHHAIFALVRRVDAPFLYANGLLLLVVTVVPFPTALLAEYWQKPGAPVAAAVYAGTFAASGVAYNLLWRTAIAERRLLRSTATEEKIQGISRSYWVGIPGYLAAAAAAFIDIHITVGICIGLLAVWILVSARRLEG
jgi:uncharacterized membrane protein